MSRVGHRAAALLLSFSAAGLASSLLVLYEYYTLRRQPPFCLYPLQGGPIRLDCQLVLSSPYSRVGPFQLDALAALWFIANIILVLAVLYAPWRQPGLLRGPSSCGGSSACRWSPT